MADALQHYPFWLAWAFFFAVGMARGQGTYWLARYVSKHTNPWLERKLSHGALTRGKTTLQRVGVAAIPLCYFTVGLQTMVLLAAGFLGITWSVFTAAQIPGVVVWAAVYSTVGFVAWLSAIEAIAGHWWPLALLIVVVTVATVAYRRSSQPRSTATS
ncbi:DedA family protein [Corynebacterium ulceribovis]|uniref:DedA family protein n=1 Tax=Corynebacterium ulceribovis TaxID=487732 RepID=UPI00036E7D86|nr:hypothetical protein [Corynebacterium ulceribovis]